MFFREMEFLIGSFFFALKAMSVTGVSSEILKCDHDQLVCPLQNITCQCTATGLGQSIVWALHSETVANFDHNGNCVLEDCIATIEVLDDGLSSKLVFPAELKPNGSLNITCRDAEGNSSTISYSIVEPPDPPVITMVMALSNYSASLFWTPSPYNCSLEYNLEVTDENTSLLFMDSTDLAEINVTTLNIGECYIFRVASVDEAERTSNLSQPILLAMKVPAPVENVSATVQVSSLMKYITVEWKVNQSSSIPLVLYYIVNHNVTKGGHQGITVYDTSVTINITNDQHSIVANGVHVIQVAAVNVIGQGPVSETILNIHVVGQESTNQTLSTTLSTSETSVTLTAVSSFQAVTVSMTSHVQASQHLSSTASHTVSTTSESTSPSEPLTLILGVGGSVLFLLIIITITLIAVIVITKHRAAKTTEQCFGDDYKSYSKIKTTFASTGHSLDQEGTQIQEKQDSPPPPPPQHLDCDEFRPTPPSPPPDNNTEMPPYPVFEPPAEVTTYSKLTRPHKKPQIIPPPEGSYSELGPTKSKQPALPPSTKPKVPNEVVYAELSKKPKNAPIPLPFELNPVVYCELRQLQAPPPPSTAHNKEQTMNADLQITSHGDPPPALPRKPKIPPPPSTTPSQEQTVCTDLQITKGGNPPPALPRKKLTPPYTTPSQGQTVYAELQITKSGDLPPSLPPKPCIYSTIQQ